MQSPRSEWGFMHSCGRFCYIFSEVFLHPQNLLLSKNILFLFELQNIYFNRFFHIWPSFSDVSRALTPRNLMSRFGICHEKLAWRGVTWVQAALPAASRWCGIMSDYQTVRNPSARRNLPTFVTITEVIRGHDVSHQGHRSRDVSNPIGRIVYSTLLWVIGGPPTHTRR